MNQPSLPFELIRNIIDFVVSSDGLPIPPALPPWHPITKTLLALTRTSRSIYPIARRLLYSHCLYLRNLGSITLLTRTLKESSAASGSPALLPPKTSLYLSVSLPSPGDGASIHDAVLQNIDSAIIDLFHILRSSLYRLIVDIAFSTLRYHYMNKRWATLMSAFDDLPVLEEFSSMHYYMPKESLFSTKTNMWPHLKTLVLYHETLDIEFLSILKRWEHLEGVVMASSDYRGEFYLGEEWAKLFQSEPDVRPLQLVLVELDKNCLSLQTRKDDKLQVRQLSVVTSLCGQGVSDAQLIQGRLRANLLHGLPISEWS